MIYVGTTAWNIPQIAVDHFPIEGNQLERYSLRLDAVEINSSFNKDHKKQTYEKWMKATPDYFSFSVKLHKRFTHQCNLEIDELELIENLKTITHLGKKFGVLLLQFPKNQDFDYHNMKLFYQTIRKIYLGPVALEPRNLSWISDESRELMNVFNISKVTADPEKCPFDHDSQIKYYRLHGSPVTYKSNYDEDFLNNLYDEITSFDKEVWCIFDNSTYGHATNNAIMIKDMGASRQRYQRVYDSWSDDLHTLSEY